MKGGDGGVLNLGVCWCGDGGGGVVWVKGLSLGDLAYEIAVRGKG